MDVWPCDGLAPIQKGYCNTPSYFIKWKPEKQSLALNAELQKTIWRCFIVILIKFDAIIFFFYIFWRSRSLDPKTVIAVAVLVCATILWMLIGHIQQFILRSLLQYKAFLYEPRGYVKFSSWLDFKKNARLFERQGIYHKSYLLGTLFFYVSNWRRDHHFTWSSEPHEGLATCSAKGVPYFLSYFKALSIGLAPGIEPATFRSALKCSTDWATLARSVSVLSDYESNILGKFCD